MKKEKVLTTSISKRIVLFIELILIIIFSFILYYGWYVPFIFSLVFVITAILPIGGSVIADFKLVKKQNDLSQNLKGFHKEEQNKDDKKLNRCDFIEKNKEFIKAISKEAYTSFLRKHEISLNEEINSLIESFTDDDKVKNVISINIKRLNLNNETDKVKHLIKSIDETDDYIDIYIYLSDLKLKKV